MLAVDTEADPRDLSFHAVDPAKARTLSASQVAFYGAPLEGPQVTNDLRAGEVSLHSDLLLHGSAANTSGRRRAALTIRYAAADVRPLRGADWYVNAASHCRGTIPAHWPNRRRPTSEHPELLSHLWGDFDGTPVVTR